MIVGITQITWPLSSVDLFLSLTICDVMCALSRRLLSLLVHRLLHCSMQIFGQKLLIFQKSLAFWLLYSLAGYLQRMEYIYKGFGKNIEMCVKYTTCI